MLPLISTYLGNLGAYMCKGRTIIMAPSMKAKQGALGRLTQCLPSTERMASLGF